MLSQVVSVTNHTLVLDSNGEVWGSGSNYNKQLGMPEPSRITNPQVVPGLPPISSVEAGYASSFFLTPTGEVWATGSNFQGRLGLPQDIAEVDHVTLISELSNIIKVSSMTYTLFLDSEGRVFGCGDNEAGELGFESNDSVYGPTLLPIDAIAVDISVGQDFTLILDNEGRVWGAGIGSSGELGTILGEDEIMSFSVIPDLPPIKAISTGPSHSVVLTTNGEVIVFGRLHGYDLHPDYYMAPSYINDIPLIRTICAGDFHDLLISENGELYISSNSRLQQHQEVPVVTKVDLPFLVSTASADNHHLIVDTEGNVYRFDIRGEYLVETEEEREREGPFYTYELYPIKAKMTAEDSPLIREPYLSFELIQALLKVGKIMDYRVRTYLPDDMGVQMEFELENGDLYLGYVGYNPSTDIPSRLDNVVDGFNLLKEVFEGNRLVEHKLLPELYRDERGNQALRFDTTDGDSYTILVSVEGTEIFPPNPLD